MKNFFNTTSAISLNYIFFTSVFKAFLAIIDTNIKKRK